MQGLHLTADLHGCDPALAPMTEPVGELFHHFAPSGTSASPTGVTGVVLLAESHLAVHTWPELGAVTLDVYVCNFGADNSARAEMLLAGLIDAFAPGRVERHALHRGGTPGS
jgi:S-adenosylmethionine decarboxylase